MFRLARKATTALGMATLGLAAVGAGVATTASAEINSNLYIDPANTSVLGGGQRGAFTVAGTNLGEVAVEVIVRNGETDTALAVIAPGATFEQDFGRGEGALLRNTSATTRAHVKVRVTGATGNLGMGYEEH